MRFSRAIFLTLMSSSSLSSAAAFCPPSARCSTAASTSTTTTTLAVASNNNNAPDARTTALSNYLIKAHTEKLRAIKVAEDAKNVEIQQLREKVAALEHQAQASRRASMAAAASSRDNLLALSKEQLVDLIHQYQHFLADYVVKASEAKYRAVEEAKKAVLARFGIATAEPSAAVKPVESNAAAAAAAAVTSDSTASASSSTSSSLYDSRNEAVKASAAANKSRWGEAELQRLESSIPTSATITQESSAASSPHLAEYDSRNENVLQAWLQGKSRWMDEEIQRLQGKVVLPQTSTSAVTMLTAAPIMSQSFAQVNSAIDAADHGLRADGGVGGLSLGDRVTNGAKALAENVQSYYYGARNQNIMQAATKDKARWGQEELDRVQNKATIPEYNKAAAASGNMIAATPPLSLTQAQVDQAVEAADHGLRADGGVGGWSLGERVNMGATAVAAASASVSPNVKTGYANIGAAVVSGAATSSTSSPLVSGQTTAAESSPYQQRNENVLMAAINGLTRWGADEIARIQSGSSDAAPISQDDLAKIQAADHGLRADGGVGGMTLMERITQGLNVGQAAVANAAEIPHSSVSSVNILYDERNRNVLKQGSQSRWGVHEIQRIQFSNSTGTPANA